MHLGRKDSIKHLQHLVCLTSEIGLVDRLAALDLADGTLVEEATHRSMGLRRPFGGEPAVRARKYVFANGAIPAHCMEGHGKPNVRHRVVSSKRFEDLVGLPMVMRACNRVLDVL